MKNYLRFLIFMCLIQACSQSPSKPAPDAPVADSTQMQVDKAARNLSEAVLLGQNTAKTAVTSNLNMAQDFEGVKVNWSSSQPKVISTSGLVQRPAASTCPANALIGVHLIADMSKAEAKARREFDVSVLCLPLSDKEATERAAQALTNELILGKNISLAEVRLPLNLVKQGTEGTTIHWESSNPEIISNEGIIVQDMLESRNVELTAHVTRNNDDTKRTFPITVLPQLVTDQDKLQADQNWLARQDILNGQDKTHILRNLNLPVNGPYASKITWTFFPEGYVNSDGVVTQPPAFSDNAEVTLTAHFTRNEIHGADAIYKISVIARDATPQQSVDEDYKQLTDDRIKGQNSSLDKVIVNLDLPDQGQHGSRITWNFRNTPNLTTTGVVTRPAWNADPVRVELTASVAYAGASTKTKTFIVTVLPVEDDAQVVETVFNAEAEKFLGRNTSSSKISEPLVLSTSPSYGSTITWKANPSGRIDPSGAVNLPNWNESSVGVQLTLEVTKGTAHRSQVFNLTLVPTPKIDKDRVEADVDWLTNKSKWLANNANSSTVTESLALPGQGLVGKSLIVWSVDSNPYLNAAGTVIRPKALQENALVTLRFKVKSNDVERSGEFPLTILAEEPNDEQAIGADLAALSEEQIKGVNESLAKVVLPLRLSKEGIYRSAISWTSEPAGIIEANGTIRRPAWKAGERTVEVTLRATARRGNADEKSRSFTVSVMRLEANDEETVAADKEALNVAQLLNGNESHLKIRSNLELPRSGAFGSKLVWNNVGQASPISSSGEVVQPPFGSSSVPASLKVTISKGNATDFKTFNFIVLPKDPSGLDKLKADKASLTLESILNGQDKDKVTGDLQLRPFGSNGSAYKWSISEPDTVDASGHVNRPAWDSRDKPVILRALISRSDTSQTDWVEFRIQVLKREGTAEQKIDADLALLTEKSIMGQNPSLAEVTKSLNLKNLGANGSKISWTLPEGGQIKGSGAVQLPLYDLPAVTVTLRADLSLEGLERTQSFTVTLLPAEATDTEAMQATLNWLNESRILGQNKSLNAIISDLNLITAGLYKTSISWTTPIGSRIQDSGKVERPSVKEGDQNTQLIASITRGQREPLKKTFDVKVIAVLPNLSINDGQKDLSSADLLVLEPGQNLTFTVRPVEGDLLTYKIACEGPTGITFVNTQLILKNLPAGSYSVICTVSRAGQSKSVNFQVVVNGKPKISCSPAETYAPGTEALVPCMVTDTEGDKIDLSIAASDCPNVSVDTSNTLHVPLSFHNCKIRVTAKDAVHTLDTQVLVQTDPSALQFELKKAQTSQTLGNSPRSVAIHNGKIYATSSAGLWQSSDKGSSWSVIVPTPENGLKNANAKSIRIQGKNIVMWSEDYISWSIDEGQTWQTHSFSYRVNGPLTTIMDAVITDRSLFVRTSYAPLFSLSWQRHDLNDSPESWTFIDPPGSSMSYQSSVLLGWRDKDLFESRDEGKTWRTVMSGLELRFLTMDPDQNITMLTESLRLWTCKLENCVPAQIEGSTIPPNAYGLQEMDGFIFTASLGSIYYADKNNLRDWYKSSVYTSIGEFAVGDGLIVAQRGLNLLIGEPGGVLKTVPTGTDPTSAPIRDIVGFGGRTWMLTANGLFWSKDQGQNWTQWEPQMRGEYSIKVNKSRKRMMIYQSHDAVVLDSALNVIATTENLNMELGYSIHDIETDGERIYILGLSINGPSVIHVWERGSWRKGLVSRRTGYVFNANNFVTLDDVVYVAATKWRNNFSETIGYVVRADSFDVSSPTAIDTSGFFTKTSNWGVGLIRRILTIPDGRSWILSNDWQMLERSSKGLYQKLAYTDISSIHFAIDGDQAFGVKFTVSKPLNSGKTFDAQVYKLGYSSDSSGIPNSERYDLGSLGFNPDFFDATGYFPRWSEQDSSRNLIQKVAVGHQGLYVATERGLAVSHDKNYKTWKVFGPESGLSCSNVTGVWFVDDQLYVYACGLHTLRKP